MVECGVVRGGVVGNRLVGSGVVADGVVADGVVGDGVVGGSVVGANVAKLIYSINLLCKWSKLEVKLHSKLLKSKFFNGFQKCFKDGF